MSLALLSNTSASHQHQRSTSSNEANSPSSNTSTSNHGMSYQPSANPASFPFYTDDTAPLDINDEHDTDKSHSFIGFSERYAASMNELGSLDGCTFPSLSPSSSSTPAPGGPVRHHSIANSLRSLKLKSKGSRNGSATVSRAASAFVRRTTSADGADDASLECPPPPHPVSSMPGSSAAPSANSLTPQLAPFNHNMERAVDRPSTQHSSSVPYRYGQLSAPRPSLLKGDSPSVNTLGVPPQFPPQRIDANDDDNTHANPLSDVRSRRRPLLSSASPTNTGGIVERAPSVASSSPSMSSLANRAPSPSVNFSLNSNSQSPAPRSNAHIPPINNSNHSHSPFPSPSTSTQFPQQRRPRLASEPVASPSYYASFQAQFESAQNELERELEAQFGNTNHEDDEKDDHTRDEQSTPHSSSGHHDFPSHSVHSSFSADDRPASSSFHREYNLEVSTSSPYPDGLNVSMSSVTTFGSADGAYYQQYKEKQESIFPNMNSSPAKFVRTPVRSAQPKLNGNTTGAPSSPNMVVSSASRTRPFRNNSLATPSSTSISASPLAGSGGVSNPNDEGICLASSDLLPCDHPASEVSQCLRTIKSPDWSARFESITSIRRLAIHHSVHVTPHVKALIRDLRPEVDSLRSSIARNAIRCLTDLFQYVPKAAEIELDLIAPSLLKRAGEPSGFLAEEAQRALATMIVYCSDSKTLPVLLNAATTGTKVIKSMACVYVDRAIEEYGSKVLQSKDIQRLYKAIGTFASDAAAPSRHHSKLSLLRLGRIQGLDDLDRTMKKLLPAAQYQFVKKVLDKGLDQEVQTQSFGYILDLSAPTASFTRQSSGEQDSNTGIDSLTRSNRARRIKTAARTDSSDGVSSAKNSISSNSRQPLFDLDNPDNSLINSLSSSPGLTSSVGTGSVRSAAKRRPTINSTSAQDLDKLNAVLSEMQASDWKVRLNGISKMLEFIQQSPSATQANLTRIFDTLTERINDNNGKVNVAALQSLSQVIPAIKAYISPVLTSFVPALANNLAATNVSVRSLCSSSLDLLMEHVDSTQLTPSFSQVAMFGNSKVRPAMVEKLQLLVNHLIEQAPSPHIMYNGLKSIVPVAFSVSEETRSEVRAPLLKLLQTIYNNIGANLFEEKLLMQYHISTLQATKIKQLLQVS